MDPASVATGASVVKTAADHVIGEDESEKQALVRMGERTPAMQIAAEARAKRVAAQQAIRLRLLSPFGKLIGLSDEYFRTSFDEDLAAKTAHVPEKDLVDPPSYIAVPVLQGLAYSSDEPDLKEMYLNLLADALDGRTSAPHPSFVEVIKQLSAPESVVLKRVLEEGRTPIARVVFTSLTDGSKIIPVSHLLSPEISGDRDPDELAVFVDNWMRLSLVEVSYGEYFSAEGLYEWIEVHPVLKAYQALDSPKTPTGDLFTCAPDKGTLEITAFGRAFLRRAISHSLPQDDTTDPA